MLFVLAAKQTVVAHMPTSDPLDQPTIIYVDDDADGFNVGTNWENAVNSLQDALLLAYFLDKPLEIRVAEGIYTPDRGLGIMPGDSSVSFHLINNVTIKGGYAANSGGRRGVPDVRDVNQYKSVLSGDLNTDDGPGLDTVKENSFHVVTTSENDTTAVLDGFTITGSNIAGGGTNPYNHSSGMYNDKSSPMLIDCTFTGNKATERGAGMYNNNSNPVLLNCTFSENAAPAGGAGMYNDNSSPILTNCTFSRNSVGDHGAGMYNNNSSPVLQNCIFISNYASMNGGGMHNEKSYPALTNCTFTDNSAGDDGGAIYSGLSDISLSDCIFKENRAEDDGGGLSHVNGNIHLTGCIFVGNSALPPYLTTHSNNWGGAMEISILSGNKAVATDCLFRNNSAVYGGAIQGNLTALRGCRFTSNVAYYRGGAIDSRGTLTCENCLFEGNKAMEHVAVVYSHGALLFTNCTFVENRSPDGYTFLASGGHGAPQNNFFTNCIIRGADPIFRPGRSWLQKTLITYCNIQGGWPGEGNIDVDPYFAERNYWDSNGTADDPNDDFWIDGDYHLKSQAGRWNPASESWVVDDVTSPCIDTGDPNSPVAFEPFPNGGIINMGAYGGTAEASISISGIHAKYGGGTGEPNDPYLIYTSEHMNTIGTEHNDWDRHFKLMADIDLSCYTGTEFNIIGISGNTFTGVFNGNGHTISNFTYTSAYSDPVGIFASIRAFNALIKNLGLIDPNINAGIGSGVGSLAGRLLNGTIANCYVTGGNISGKRNVGGLVGSNDDVVTASYSHTSVMGMDEIGGLVGHNSHYGEIADCYAGGDVVGQSYIGGLVGTNNTVGIHGGLFSGKVSNCYSAASVSGDEHVGGLVGGNEDRGVSGSFWDIETSGQIISAGGTGKTTAELQTASTFLEAGWDFVNETANGTEDIWWILEGQGYPRLLWETTENHLPDD